MDAEGAQESGAGESLENILVLASCLEQPSRLVREEHDNDSVNKIVLWISKTILPDGSIVSKDDIASSLYR